MTGAPIAPGAVASSTKAWPAAARLLLATALVAIGIWRAESLDSLLMYSAIWAISAIGVSLMLGLTDQPLLCQASFMLVGAYVYGVLARIDGPALPPLTALLCAAAAGLAVGALLSPSVRVRGYTFALLTITIDLFIRRVLTTGDWLPGGQLGLVAIPHLRLGEHVLESATDYLWLTGGLIVVVTIALQLTLGRGRRRRIADLVSNDEGLLAEFGRNPLAFKRMVLIITAGLGALAGAIYAATFGFVQPTTFTLADSFALAIAVTIGGKGRVAGAVLGALVFQMSYAIVGETHAELRVVMLGCIVIATMHFFPDGLLPSRRDVDRLLARTRAGRSATSAPVREEAPHADTAAARAGIGVRVQGATQAFGSLRALDGLDLDIAPGSFTALVGPNGSGKSTLLAALSGRRLTTGCIWFDDHDVTAEPPHRRSRHGLARTFQRVRVLERVSVLDNVLVGVDLAVLAHQLRAAETDRRRMALRALDRVRLAGLADRRTEELSLAQRRLVEVARALAAEPRLLLLDEPTSGLDAEACEILADVLRDLHATGCTIIIVEHNLRFAQAVASRVAALVDGRLLAHGPSGEVFAIPAFASAYLGTGIVP